MKITVFQALTLLAQKYHSTPACSDIYKKIKRLYLSGVQSDADKELLQSLLQDNKLSNYTISDDWTDINEDPVRRYFESTLCIHTLKTHIDFLNLDLLTANLNAICSHISNQLLSYRIAPIFNQLSFIRPMLRGNEKEFYEAINLLNQEDSLPFLKPEKHEDEQQKMQVWKQRKQKLSALTKITYAALGLASDNNKKLPLMDLFYDENSLFHDNQRGRITKIDPRTGRSQKIYSQAYGVMCSYMPLPQSDLLFANQPSNYPRPTDRSRFEPNNALVPKEHFATKVTPFVASISGTMLAQIRVYAHFVKRKTFVFNGPNEQQLPFYFKSLISFLIYFSGGHSLKEFVRVLELNQVQAEFETLPLFRKLNLEQLFKHDNEAAFEEAIKHTIIYNQRILARKSVHEELVKSTHILPTLKLNYFLKRYEKHKDEVKGLLHSTARTISLYTPPNQVNCITIIMQILHCSSLRAQLLQLANYFIKQLKALIARFEDCTAKSTDLKNLVNTTEECSALSHSIESTHEGLVQRYMQKASDDPLHHCCRLFSKNSLLLKQRILADSEVVESSLFNSQCH
jgi:hypothetical protein